ncbi:hypothetical protein CDD82_6586 [Ophiocordyceps australis]|uniref:Thioredoxin domain-containing protein n=1 Tax=Ophiocordyceps australis TaxID=1399860 RepID=A0A2C5XZP2_9HYPO|nr:hypothetical protein CDD82_6586 [Ophiocordyceps australis]
MSGPVNISSSSEWQSLLSKHAIVVADFYADWCGPCKMIAPHFERLAQQHSRPQKVAFAKINVDSQQAIARAQAVSAMPTFKIFHAGACIDTIKGANPPALAEAVTRALRLADAAGPGASFKTPGRTLGGQAASPRRLAAPSWNMTGFIRSLIIFVGLYLFSLFAIDARKGAEASPFNIHKPRVEKKPSSTAAASKPAPKPAFRTLADLGGD